jgi:MarC family integral membrane protein
MSHLGRAAELFKVDLAAFPLAIPLSQPWRDHRYTLAGEPDRRKSVVASSSLSRLLRQHRRSRCCWRGQLARLLGRTGNIMIARLLGIVLAAFAAQFMIDGIKAAFHWTE